MTVLQIHQVRYGAQALSALRQIVAEAKQDDPLAPVTVLAPNNLAGIVARRSLARGVNGRTGIAGLEVTTVARLAERLAAAALAPRRPATGPVLAAAWRAALLRDPGVFEAVADHPATVEALVRADQDLAEVSDPGLHATAAVSALARDVVRLHRDVRERLAPDWYSRTDLLATAQPDIETVATVGTVVVYLPQQLSAHESQFLARLAGACSVKVVLGLTGNSAADRPVIESLHELSAHHNAVDVPQPTVEVLTASDADDEVRLVVRRVLVALQGFPAHRVAVLHTRSDPYARLLHEHLSAAGVTFNGPGIRSVRERPLGRLLLDLLALHSRGFPRVDLFRTLAHAPVYDLNGTRVPLSRWEHLARVAGVVAGGDWALRLDAHAELLGVRKADLEDARRRGDDDQSWQIERLDRELETCVTMRKFVDELERRLNEIERSSTWASVADHVERLLTDLVGPLDRTTLPPEEQYAASAVLGTLESLTSLDGFGVPTSVAQLQEVLELELEGAVQRVGRFGEGIFVGPLSAAIGLDLDAVLVVGAAEDLLPGRLHEDALLSNAVRVAAAGELGWPLDDLHATHRQFLAAVESAGNLVVVSFPRGDLRRSSTRLPSRFLLPALRAISDEPTLPATRWERIRSRLVTNAPSFAGELHTTSVLGTEQEWRVRQALADPEAAAEDVAVAASLALLEARESDTFTRFDGNLRGIEGLPDYAVDNAAVSPTALESYASCPHAFFVQRLLGVTPLEQPDELVEIAAVEIGNLVHQALDQLISEAPDLPGPGEAWSTAHRIRLLELADQLAAEYEARGLTGHHRLWARDRPRIMATLAGALDTDDEWRASLGARVAASELEFGPGKPIAAVQFPVTRGVVHFKGSADKVDISGDGTVLVTDVKTGSMSRFKGISEADPVLGGTKLQLPVYAAVARREFGQSGAGVAASYWFVHKDRARIELPLTDAVLTTFTACIDVLVDSIAAGLFPLKPPEAEDWDWVQCPYCNPDGVGHGLQRGRYEKKRSDPALSRLVALIDPKAVITHGEDA